MGEGDDRRLLAFLPGEGGADLYMSCFMVRSALLHPVIFGLSSPLPPLHPPSAFSDRRTDVVALPPSPCRGSTIATLLVVVTAVARATAGGVVALVAAVVVAFVAVSFSVAVAAAVGFAADDSWAVGHPAEKK